MSAIVELIEQSRGVTDPRVRLEKGQELLDYFNNGRLPSDSTVLTNFCDLIVLWLNGSNFKVGLLALDILDMAIEASGDLLAPYILDNSTALMERLGDSKEQVRQMTIDVIIRLMRVPHCSPQVVFERFTGGFTHKQWLVRVGVMQVFQSTLKTYGRNSVQLNKVVPLISKLITDPNIQVRDAAADTLLEIYVCLGDSFIADLQKRRLIPEQKLHSILQRFQEAKRNGMVGADGKPLQQSGDYVDRVPGPSSTYQATPNKRFQRPGSSSTPGSASRAGMRNGSRSSAESLEEQENKGHQQPQPQRVGSSNSRSTSIGAHKRGPQVQATARYSGSAGAVTEDHFEKQFREVPKLEIYTAKEMSSALQQIRDHLSDTNLDWNKRVDNLKRLRSVLVGGGADFPEFFSEIKLLEVPLELAVKDLRSQVVREACITVSFFAEELKLKMDRLAEAVFHCLVNLIQNSAKIMASSGRLACQYIIKYVRTPKLIPVVTSYLNSKSREIRSTMCEFIAIILVTWEPYIVERSLPAVSMAIQQGLNDADPDARTASRRAYKALADNYKEHADALYQLLEPQKQRMVATSTGDLSQSSSTHSVGIRRSQENLSGRPGGPSTYGLQRAYYGGRSTSEIDTGAARRAMQRVPVSAPRPKVPLQPMNSLQRPVPRIPSTPTSSTTTRNGPSTPKYLQSARSSTDYVPNKVSSRVRTPTIATAAKSMSSVSQHARRLSSEHGKKLTNRDIERELVDAFERTHISPSGYTLGDWDDDDASQCSERSFSRLEGIELVEAIRLCQSSQNGERRDGLQSLRSMFLQRRPMSAIELKRICECFARMFVEAHNKIFTLFLDVLADFVAAYNTDLSDWLFVLLTRLLTKSGNDLLQSVQSKVLRTLEVVRESFPYAQQFKTVCRYMQEPAHTPSIKVRIAMLRYLDELACRMEPQGLVNTPEVRGAINKIIYWMNEQKSVDVRKASQRVVLSLFALNAAEFTAILGTYPRQSQDSVYALLKTDAKTPGRVGAVGRTSSGGASGMDMGQVRNSLGETARQINQMFGGSVEVDRAKGGSQDSGIVDAVDGFAYAPSTNRRFQRGGADNLGVISDEEKQQEIIADIGTELSNHNKRAVERVNAMELLRRMARDGSFTLWDEHFKTLLMLLIETINDKDAEVRSVSLRTLKEICLCQAVRFRDYAELTLLRVLEAHCDPEKECQRAAEDCGAVLATHLPPHLCLRVLIPVMGGASVPKVLAAVKMITKVMEQLSDDEIRNYMDDVVPGIVRAYDSEESSVRKASVLCLVQLQNTVGEEPLEPFLQSLNPSKIKLLQLYVKRAQTSSGRIYDALN